MSTTKTKRKSKKLAHHAKRLYHITPRFVHGMVVGAFVAVVGILTVGIVAPVVALGIESPRDCDTNAVINCGALTTAELQQRYGNAGVGAIYDYFGISSKDIKATGKTAVAGRVYKSGKVVVNGVTVATNALTAGRKNITGSTKVTSDGVTFYTRPPSVSFRVDSIAAFVVMDDGTFDFAILAACGNPVKATALAKKTAAPPPVETLAPQPEVITVASTQAPESTPTPVVASTTSNVLPDTGPGDIGLIALCAIIGGYIFHVTHRHVRRRRQAHSL